MNLHKDDRAFWDEVENVAYRVAGQWGLGLGEIAPKARPFADAAWGICYTTSKKIAIALRFKERMSDGGAWAKSPIDKTEVMLTLSHELAHLVDHRHGEEFKEAWMAIHEDVISTWAYL